VVQDSGSHEVRYVLIVYDMYSLLSCPLPPTPTPTPTPTPAPSLTPTPTPSTYALNPPPLHHLCVLNPLPPHIHIKTSLSILKCVLNPSQLVGIVGAQYSWKDLLSRIFADDV
jgi:hypothetical protein